ncbi:MAG: hypothetical protein B6D64_10245 [Bacteroidetes bacterium 4484_276]|nr:MAG: hypothetical protein B6D64_10245 [Bacteroidetes bacterium 4484_276]
MFWFYKYRFLLPYLVVTFLIPARGNGQDNMKQLEKKRFQLEKSIEYTEVLLDENRANKTVSLEELALLEDQIANRKKLIDNYREERDSRTDTIFQLLFKIDKLATEVDALKDEYARMVYCAYKNKDFHQRMIYVLASDDFNQAYQRMNYFKVYASKRKAQVQLIYAAEDNYLVEVDGLESKIKDTEMLLVKVENEKGRLENEKQLKDIAINKLLKQEKELVQNQKEGKKRAGKLKQQIEEIIAEGLNKPGASVKGNLNKLITRTPEDNSLTNTFASSQGHLPWPLEQGVISSYFGEHNHPVLEGVKVRNNGINILAHKGSKARAVFNGQVTRVMAMPNFNKVVIIRHGDFLTVYTNLERVFVEPGSIVETKDEIGVVITDEENFRTELHFEIWNGKTLLDPEQWLVSDKSSGLLKADKP